MAGALTGVVVYDSVLFQRGHMIMRWAEAVEKRFTANAILEAPMNKRANKSTWGNLAAYAAPGALKANIRGEVYKVGPKHIQTVIGAHVPYALYVHDGTDTIFPVNGNYLSLPFNAGHVSVRHIERWGHSTPVKSVSGQAANPFLTRAHDATARRHPSLRGYSGAVFKQW